VPQRDGRRMSDPTVARRGLASDSREWDVTLVDSMQRLELASLDKWSCEVIYTHPAGSVDADAAGARQIGHGSVSTLCT
jgi:hypothetical protein